MSQPLMFDDRRVHVVPMPLWDPGSKTTSHRIRITLDMDRWNHTDSPGELAENATEASTNTPMMALVLPVQLGGI
jgi:hypothetical protein